MNQMHHDYLLETSAARVERGQTGWHTINLCA